MQPIPLNRDMMDRWSTQQKLAVYDFCRTVSEYLWQHYRDDLLEEMLRDDIQRGFDHHIDIDNPNLELPLDDPLF